MKINASTLHFRALNEQIKASNDCSIEIINCLGHRYIGTGVTGKQIDIHGVPGNALGAYLASSTLNVFGNAQDATGDTMDSGSIIIHGNCGDTTGYGMRGGKIYVQGDSGYRTGIHMKEYKDCQPVIVIGGKVGDFLGEYQAGGLIIVLGLNHENEIPVGSFCGTGMHGGAIYIRSNNLPSDLPAQVSAHEATVEDLIFIKEYIDEFGEYFTINSESILKDRFYKLTANSKNPYKQLYTHN
ncbi:glutamate synthase [Sporanaerobium hydrogeniformans]|uniref:Glutamate synthase n=1 Tax=Sporanaerobium hydrogeniformans TaxID=3072179 RepID=A0AC61DC20_9FIRM|nr:glutamate synthase [Sporanaerobium hydrogeniformans]PHV70587.1 glutamate synthase [Sporanaerobium hydrogeniformans]